MFVSQDHVVTGAVMGAVIDLLWDLKLFLSMTSNKDFWIIFLNFYHFKTIQKGCMSEWVNERLFD